MIADRAHYVVDIETLGVRDDAIIASVGIAIVENGRAREGFYAIADIGQTGRTEDDATLDWWDNKAPGAAFSEIFGSSTQKLEDILRDVDRFINTFSHAPIWGNGSDFDNRILAHAFAQHGLRWPYWRNACLRTLRNLVGGERFKPTGERTPHIAINDALTEAEELIYLLGRISVKKNIDEMQEEIERDRAKGARQTDHRLAHGKGHLGDGEKFGWIMNENCPLHGEKGKK
ncbi:MAG: 3'-5' exoribonuclease [Burkholderiales bacterium]|jgi:hypothetical protein|nr:3'-5' exoribonuclease [Burkholderiales bacterium]